MLQCVFGSFSLNLREGDNMVTSVLTGSGVVLIQSMSFHRFSQRIARMKPFFCRAVASPNVIAPILKGGEQREVVMKYHNKYSRFRKGEIHEDEELLLFDICQV